MTIPSPFLILTSGLLTAVVGTCASPPLLLQKHRLDDTFLSEGSAFGDLNNDGHQDIVAGPWWYEGPDFDRRHPLYLGAPFDIEKYSDNFFAYTHDINRDGWLDVLVLGFPGVDASWYENPAETSLTWRRHVVFLDVGNESPTFTDLLGTGHPVLVCVHQNAFGYATFNPKAPNRPWDWHPITPPGKLNRFTHGLGTGDIDGDGRTDILSANKSGTAVFLSAKQN